MLLGSDDRTPADPDGTRYAVITFLEDVLGVRCLWPGELGLVAPPRTTIAVPPLDRRFTPRIGQRQIRNSHYNDRVQVGPRLPGADEGGLRPAAGGGRHRANGSRGSGWAATWAWSAGIAFGYTWEKYHRQHPEWFAMQPNGSRDLTNLSPQRARLCKSNLALIDALARDKIEELRRTGGQAVSLCPNDGGRATFCQCPECKRLDPPEGRQITLWDYSGGRPPGVSTMSRSPTAWSGSGTGWRNGSSRSIRTPG